MLIENLRNRILLSNIYISEHPKKAEQTINSVVIMTNIFEINGA